MQLIPVPRGMGDLGQRMQGGMRALLSAALLRLAKLCDTPLLNKQEV